MGSFLSSRSGLTAIRGTSEARAVTGLHVVVPLGRTVRHGHVPPPDMFLGNDIRGAVLARSDEAGPVRLPGMAAGNATTVFDRHRGEGAGGCGL